MRRRIKRSLSRRFRYYPLLKLLVLKPWFRAAFLALVAMAIFVALYLPKIWQTTPDGFLPVVEISWLDRTQCWALKRSARKAAAAGDFENAAHSWHMAVAQDPGDFSALRGYLDNFVKLNRPSQSAAGIALTQMRWLLRLSSTNSADVERVAAVCDKFGWHEAASYFLSGAGGRISPKAEVVLAKANFQQGRFDLFKEQLARLGSGSEAESLKLYAAAFQAGWETGARADAAKTELVAAMENPERGAEAARLCLIVSARRGDIAGYEAALQKLAMSNQAKVTDHALHWVLLAEGGRREEAVRLAEAFGSSPQSAQETLRLAEVYFQLGLKNSGREVLQRFVPLFGTNAEVWRFYARFLEQAKDWNELRNVAVQMREQPGMATVLWGYSYFLEGLANHRMDLHDAAALAFAKAGDAHYDSPDLAYEIARDMAEMSHGAPALRILAMIEDRVERDFAFWETWFDAAFSARNEAAVLKSAEQSYKLRPRDVQIHNRYAAALMLNKKDPEESIKMTLQLVNLYPQSIAATINHAYALLLNRREQEARRLLETLAGRTMSPSEANAFHLGLFEIYYTLELWDQALSQADRVNASMLFPSQLDSFETKRKALPERLASRTKSATDS